MNDLFSKIDIENSTRERKKPFDVSGVSTMQCEVSVIIPTYKNPYTIIRAIDSVLAQKDFDSYEIIVVDDNDPHSEDRELTEKKLEKYRENPKIKYIKHPCNKNGAAARNTGFNNSQGRYIAFLDDDDVFLENKLRLQYDYMEIHPEFGASYTWRIQRKDDIVKFIKTGDLTEEILLLDFFPTTITIMMRRECFESIHGFDESFRRHQDFEFLIRYFEKYEIGVVPVVLSQIVGKDGKGNQLHGKQYEELKKKFLETFSEVIDRLDTQKPGTKKKIYASHYSEIFVSEIATKDFKLAFRSFLEGVRLYGLFFLKRVVRHYQIALKRRKNI